MLLGNVANVLLLERPLNAETIRRAAASAQSTAALGATLPRELLRHRIGLTEQECEL